MGFIVTRSTQRNDIVWVEGFSNVFANGNFVMNFQINARATTFSVPVSAFLAGVVVSFKGGESKFLPKSRINNASVTTFPISMVLSGSDTVGIFIFGKAFIPRNLFSLTSKPFFSDDRVVGENFMNLFPVIKGFMPWLETHFFHRWMIAFFKAFIPRVFVTSLVFSAIRMMTILVFGYTKSAAFRFLSIGGESGKFDTTSALADDFDSLFLSLGNTHNYNPPSSPVQYTQEERKPIENSVNCWNTLRASDATAQSVTTNANAKKSEDWAISSLAAWEQVESSTTRLRSPERTVKTHERRNRKVRDSLSCDESRRGSGLNTTSLTKLNSVPYTGVLDDRSAHPVRQIIHKALKNDAAKAFEAAAHTQFDATPLTVTPESGTSATAITLETSGTATATNNIAMNNVHVKLISDQMKERNISAFGDGNYRCIGRPSTFRGFKDDLETLHSYVDQGFQYILNGEVGRSYEGVRFFEQTAIASRAWTNSASDQAFFFGDDTVMEAIVVPPEIRGKIPGDYGRDKGVAWYAQEGFALVHTDATEARIIEWASAA